MLSEIKPPPLTSQDELFVSEHWEVPEIREWREEGKRFLECPVCSASVPVSVVPHLRKKHPDTWKAYVRIFEEMHRAGYSYKQIMWAFQRRFTWLVVARELAESIGKPLSVDLTRVKLDPAAFKLQTTTRWSFPQRGKWGLHDSRYRGNWAPEVPRNLIERYSPRAALVLDPFVGGGTTVLEAMSLGRTCIGIDISSRAVHLTSEKATVLAQALELAGRPVPHWQVTKGDARALPMRDGTVDLVCAHPPYLDIIQYTKSERGDLSRILDPSLFQSEMRKIVLELHRVMQPNGVCAVLIGDVRRGGELIPLGFLVMRTFMDAFQLVEIIVKDQHKSAMSMFWNHRNGRSPSLTLAHEYLLIFRKSNDAHTPGFLAGF